MILVLLRLAIYLAVGLVVVRVSRRLALALPISEAAKKHIETTPIPGVGLAVFFWPVIVVFGLGAGALLLLGQLAGGKTESHGPE